MKSGKQPELPFPEYHPLCRCDKAECWKKVYGRPYEVSNKARVRNLNSGKLLKPYKNGDPYGYLRVDLCKPGGKESKKFYLHRLVAMYHKLRDDPKKREVHHKEEVVDWCCECNVEWVTYIQNIIYRNRRNGYGTRPPEDIEAPF